MGKHLEKNIKKISIKNELNSAIAQSSDLNKDYDNGVTKACQLGLMGV
jgi:hypothetical protein